MQKLALLGLLIAFMAHTFCLPAIADPEKAAARSGLKVGLALGGGGTRGAAHIGVLRILEREGIHVDMIAGTSIGAIVGGLYCAGLSVDDIESKFKTPTLMKSYMTVPILVSVVARPLFLFPRIFGWRPYDGFYFGNKFRNTYKKCLPSDETKIENLKIPFRAMTTNLCDGRPFAVDRGDLALAVQASSAIPILRRPVPLRDDAILVDGAVLVNVPVEEVRAMGADLVIAISVSESLDKVPGDTFRKVGSVAKRLETVFLSLTDTSNFENADVVIHPRTNGISILSIRSNDAIEAIKAGEEATIEALPAIRAKLATLKSAGKQ